MCIRDSTLPHSYRVLKHSHRHLNKFKSDVLETLLCMTKIIGSIRNATVLEHWNREWMFFLQTKYVKVTGIMKVNIKIPSLCCSLCSTRNSLKCHNVNSTTVIAKIKGMPRSLFYVIPHYVTMVHIFSFDTMWRNPCIWSLKSCQLHVVTNIPILTMHVKYGHFP